MPKVTELREEMAQLHADARTELDKVNDKMSAGEVAEASARFDTAMVEFDKREAQVKQHEAIEARQAVLTAGDARAPSGAGETFEARAETSASEKEIFLKRVRQGSAALTQEERAQTSLTDASGAFTVPTDLSSTIDINIATYGPMYDGNVVGELVTSSGNPFDYPTVDDTAQVGETTAENVAMTDDGTGDVVFGSVSFGAHLADTKIVRIPMQLLEDSAFNIEALMTELFAERLGRNANTFLTTGATGVVTAATLGDTAASASAVTSDELMDFQVTVDAAYRKNPKTAWMFNDTTWNMIRKLKDGQGNYLWSLGEIRLGEESTLLGNKYVINNAMVNIGIDADFVVYGDLSKYMVRKVNGFTMRTLRERYAEFNQVGMIGFKRFDGQLVNTGAVKRLRGAAA